MVSIPKKAGSTAESPDQEPLLDVSGDQSGLPPCDGENGKDEIKKLLESSPLGQTQHISVLHASDISIRPIRDAMAICTASMTTNGGELTYDFQYYRKDGEVFVFGKPHEQ